MKKLSKGILGIFSYCIFRLKYSKHELLMIETNIFGHAILESALLAKYVHENPRRKVFYVLHSHSANTFLTKSIVGTLNELKVKHSKLATYAVHGQDILVNRLRIRHKLKTVKFQENLTHLTASELNPKYIPKFNFRYEFSNLVEDESKTIILMNRSTAYKKFQELSSLHSFRNFDFSTLDSLNINPKNPTKFIRIGAPDGIGTRNSKIIDRRQEIAIDPELDIKLQSSASGYFGADSGPVWFTFALKKPVAFINMIPLNQISPIEANKLVVIPKLIYSRKMERLLTISEMLSEEISNMKSTDQYIAADLELISNTNEDVSNFFEDWLLMISNSTEIVDDHSMIEIRSKFGLPNLPSIHGKFIQNHPEVFLNE